jgi:hypothetical protein
MKASENKPMGMLSLCMAALVCVLVLLEGLVPTVAQGAGSIDTCPNASYRDGGLALSESLPDCRAYEMVSPLDKNGSNIGASAYYASRSSVDGERVWFLANSGFGDTVGSGHTGMTDYIAVRGAGGWLSRGITPPSALTDEETVSTEKKAFGFSNDLAYAVFLGDRLPNADPGTGAENYYREDTSSRALETVTLDELHCGCLSVTELLNMEYDLVGYSSSDAGTVVFETKLPLLPGVGSKEKLYEWNHGTLRVAGTLPDGSISTGGSAAASAPSYKGGVSSIDNADTVSSEGSKVLFSSPYEGSKPQLYMRKDGSHTVWLSRSWDSTPDAEPAGVLFQAASADDTRVLFTSESRLLNSDTGEGKIGIYLYTDSQQNMESEEKLQLIARVNGEDNRGVVAGMSEDATHIYFFNTGPTSAISRKGEFLWDHGTLHFVAPILGGIHPFVGGIDPTGEDYPTSGAWGTTFSDGGSHNGTAVRVSSDGRRIAFLWPPNPELEPEMAKLAPNQDNSDGHLALYLYDEGSEKITCVSCPPDGALVTSDVVIASRVGNVSYGESGGEPFFQRYLSSDGRYVFFTTAQSLVPQDTNGLADVYEYDADTGELALLSSGTGESGSWFEDASADGSNVFFLTAQKLTGWDTDTLTDLYDARINGGYPEPVPPSVPCDGDACQGIPSAVPSFNTASGFSGLGNQHADMMTTVKKAKAKAKKRVKKHQKKRRGKRAVKSRAGKSNRRGR